MAQGLGFSVGKIDLSLITFWERYKLLFPFFCGCIIFPLYLFPFLSGYDPSKWLLLYIFSSISFLLMIPGNSFYVPSLSRVQKYLLIGVGLILVFNYFYHGISFFGKETIDRLMFWALFFFYCSCLKGFKASEKADLFYALFLGTGLFIVWGFFNFIFIKPQLSFSFGNLNKAAEFVGFSLALQLGLLSSYSKRAQKWLILLISLSIAYLYFAKCRSVWIGTACVFAYLLWIKGLPIRPLLSILLITLLLIGGFEIIFLALGDIPLNLSVKDGSFHVRWQLLLNTVFLFIDHPLGIGLGRFGFAAVPYMKTLPYNVFTDTYYLSSPFNEPLRFLVEEGVVVGVTLFLFFASFFFPFQKIKTMSTRCPESVAFLIFLLVQSAFQYPLSQPFVLFLLPFVLAYTCRYTIGFQFMRIPFLSWIKGGLGVFFCFATLAMGTSIYLSTLFSLDTRLSKSVYFFWKNQNLLNTILFISYVNKDYEKMKQLALQELEREPQNNLALKYLGLANLKLGNLTQGCVELKAYNKAYIPPSTVFEELSTYCE